MAPQTPATDMQDGNTQETTKSWWPIITESRDLELRGQSVCWRWKFEGLRPWEGGEMSKGNIAR